MIATYMLAFAGALVLAAGYLFLWVVWNAFIDSPGRGFLSLLLPGYVLFYGLARLSDARRNWVVGGALGALAAAVVLGFSSMVVTPRPTLAGVFTTGSGGESGQHGGAPSD